MKSTAKMKNCYLKIQRQLFYMIPEKWDSIYLYASSSEKINNIRTGEMFFYYFPKGVIRKNPVNVYEVTSKFKIDELAYSKLIDKLYDTILELKEAYIENELKVWTNITISIENFKFRVEYDFENLELSQYSNYERHVIWKYKYINNVLESYTKKERKLIEWYLATNFEDPKVKKENTYEEAVYNKPVGNIISQYEKKEQFEKRQEMYNEEEIINNQIITWRK